jgi:alpha-N-arabinofuranosidase
MTGNLVIVDRRRGLRPYSRMIFGHFIEHFHRQVYGGIFDPGSPLSDARGFRLDVIAALKELDPPIVRWPGGNFVSDYHWRDAVGPEREPSFNMAWQVEEPNTFGTDEFLAWCRAVGAEPYICTNGGNGSPQEMSDWVEYCNGNLSTRIANLRRRNGHAAPYGVRYWGIGNESYGDWQIGAKTVGEWGPYVAESAKMMRRVDEGIILSAAALPDVDWTLALLRAAGRYLDLVSIHDYWDPLWPRDEPRSYLSAMMQAEKPDALIAKSRAILEVAGFAGKVGIAFDEWNLRGWHHPAGGSPEAIAARDRNDIDATYTMADAIFSAGFFNACLRNADIVKMANISPTVNARGPLFVHSAGIVRRTSWHALKMYVDGMAPLLADTFVKSDRLASDEGSVAVIDAVASSEQLGGPVRLMLLNRDPERSRQVAVEIDGEPIAGKLQATILSGSGPDDYNSIAEPDRVKPFAAELAVVSGSMELPPHAIVSLTIFAAG